MPETLSELRTFRAWQLIVSQQKKVDKEWPERKQRSEWRISGFKILGLKQFLKVVCVCSRVDSGEGPWNGGQAH